MKKLMLILLLSPIVGFGQDVRGFSTYDIIINQLLENTASFIKDKNAPKTNFRFYLTSQQSSLNWNAARLSKWQILEKRPKELKQ